MTLLQTPSLLLAFIGSAAFTLMLLLLWVRARKRRQHQARQIQKLSSELAMMQAGNIGLGKKMLIMGRQLQAQMAETEALRVQVLERPAITHDGVRSSPAPSYQHRTTPFEEKTSNVFDQAQQLLINGSEIEQVIRQTGLTRSEAELIQLLNQPSNVGQGREPRKML